MKTRLLLLVALLAGCSSDPSTGTGSQTGNSIMAGRILDSLNQAVPGTQVTIRPLSWTPSRMAAAGSIQTGVTDDSGRYEFQVPVDTYRIEARSMSRGWSRTVKVGEGDTAKVPDGTIQKWGRLFVEVELCDTILGGELYFYGLDRSVQIPDTGAKEWKHLVDSLPVGLQTICLWSKKTNSVIINLPVRIGPDSTSKIEYEHGNMGVEGPEEDDR